ncbi:glycosyltransferase [Actinomadura sp. 7K507]|uniref:glycosyltransferase n=1 Tax=Actinomadura sp. 7K507 TaxID=2530365 RepID=UPI0010429B61|nr:glycosyltransferase [Actinomadura sp. 7K507]TDC84928.1 glycosyltransferase [Actinomadura sp. 7K507]
MRIVIVAVGSRGDVAPYTGLGARLQDAGHEVAIAAHEPLGELVRKCGLEYRPLPMDLRAELTSAEGGRVLRTSPLALARFARMYARHWSQMADATLAAAQGSDLLLLSTMGWLGIHVAEGLGIPSMGVYLQPMDPTREFPPAVLTTRSLGHAGNRTAMRTMRVAGQMPFRSVVKDLRKRLDLPPMGPAALFRRLDRTGWPVHYGFSPLVVPRPADWPSGRDVVGYWWPESVPDWRPPEHLTDFLDAGPPPVFVGFGSMNVGDGARMGELVASALRRAGMRGVIQAGWGELAAGAHDDVISIGDVPHDWLFPRMAAVVHHGGAGTTAAGLRAGVPTVIVPSAADQPFWGARIAKLGAGSCTGPLRRLSTGELTQALRDAPSHRDRAREISQGIAEEDGAGQVVKAIARL